LVFILIVENKRLFLFALVKIEVALISRANHSLCVTRGEHAGAGKEKE